MTVMRRSLVVQLSFLPLLASVAVASAQPAEPGEHPPVSIDPSSEGGLESQPAQPGPSLETPISPPGLTPTRPPPPLSPPSASRTIFEMSCEEDPYAPFRPDCDPESDGGVVRGGFGGYFHGGHGSGG